MKPTGRTIPSLFAFLLAAVLAQAAAGCGSGVEPCEGADCGGNACQIDPPGETFTIHVHNGGSQMLRLAYGCGKTLPIEIETPGGHQRISPGPADTCEVACDTVYAGQPNNPCSDCGSGVGADLGPGMIADIEWDRRIYVAHTADPKCSGNPDGNSCALGQAVAPATAQAGVLTTCTDMVSGGAGYCLTADENPVSFLIDTTNTEGTIEIP
jgi:hypothetical protein